MFSTLPTSIKVHIASFLDRRENTMLSQVNKTENNNKIPFICASLAKNPDQIKETNDLTIVIAQLLKLKFKDICESEKFESLMIRFIGKLDPNQTPFLNENTDVTNKAQYSLIVIPELPHRISFKYMSAEKRDVIAMARILNQYFPESCAKVVQLKEGDNYHLFLDKNAFLQQILPCLFGIKPIPKKQFQFHEPEVSDYEPPKPKTQYYITKKDGTEFTKEDMEMLKRTINESQMAELRRRF